MEDFTIYKNAMEQEVLLFRNQIDPTTNNSPRAGNARIDEFLDILPQVEKHMTKFCEDYFEGKKLGAEERATLKAVNQKIYDDFIDYCKIPTISKK